MKTKLTPLVVGIFLMTDSASAATRYVWPSSPSPAPPYTNWTSAAHVIQDAVDAAQTGDTVLVAGGVYATGGRAVYGSMTNRVAIDRAITVESLMGPEVTIIQGYQVPGTTNGDGAIRCVYLASGASLSGFTLTGGATRTNGDYYVEQNGGGLWCDSIEAVVSNCVLVGNSASGRGGGAFRGTLNDCTLSDNSAGYGGGTSWSELNRCTLTGNQSTGTGTAWSGDGGGGAHDTTLNNCTLPGNSARSYGGGAIRSALNNCTLTGNSASYAGGGAAGGTLYNCTLTGNAADRSGGGASGIPSLGWADCTLVNCILYYNTAPVGANYDSHTTLNYCCTTPLPDPSQSVGNLAVEPQLVSASHLSASSPCRGAGDTNYVSGTDIDGEAWATPPAIGCDEYHAGSPTGPLSANILAAFMNVAVGFPAGFTALIEGRPTASVWDFGSGNVTTNRPFTTHAWEAPGNYAVVLRAYNDSYPGGVTATVTIHVMAPPVHYVAVDGTNPVPPYTSWATAATNIQEAVDAGTVPGALVLVSNGVYATGGRLMYGSSTNRVAVTKSLALRSVNGPQFTVIEGGQMAGEAIRCVYLSAGASLSGFTLANGVTRADGDYDLDQSGGGVWCESTNAFATNCVIVGNAAYQYGGGAYRGTLVNCILNNNSGLTYGWGFSGGATYKSTLHNCTLTGNSADSGGGAYQSTLNNCTLADNSADTGAGAYGSTLNNCTLTGNSGSAVDNSTLHNCLLTRNSTGASASTLNNCTLTGNSGGVSLSTLNNCIAYYNTWNHLGSTLNYCCTTPNPGGLGNITADPQLTDGVHVSAASPCRGAGSASHSTGVDIDGEPWASPPSIGCDEYYSGSVTGALTVAIVASYTNVMPQFRVDFQGSISGRFGAWRWEFGDGTVLSNRFTASHAWTALGDYPVVLRAYNASHPEGVSATVTIHVVPGLYYVAAASANPLWPYTSWTTAATNIQDAVDAAVIGGTITVTNGTYATGGRNGSRVAVDKLLTIRSVNGPEFTVVDGGGVVGCVYLTNSTFLSGLTLTNGSGAGVSCESFSAIISNCIIVGNSGVGAYFGTLNNCTLRGNSARDGGGAYSSRLNNCTLTGNSASNSGGGAYSCTLRNCLLINNSAYGYSGGGGGGAFAGTLFNCTLTGNSARSYGGGATSNTLYNCIVYFNTAPNGANHYYSTLSYSCTTPLPVSGAGNISEDPELASASRLSLFSSCRGAGHAAYASGVDIDGEAWGTPPSIGCDEYHAGAVTGPLSVGIAATYTNVAVGYAAGLTALIEGRATLSIWDFGDGTQALDQPYPTHAWTTPGNYLVSVWAFNDSHPEGVSATMTIHVGQGLHYVAVGSTNPVSPYTSWATAATNIQDAVDAADLGGSILVSDGLYRTGARAVYDTMTSRVAVYKPLTLRSVNGPQFTLIQGWQVPGTTNGAGAIRCVYLTSGASLSGFTLTNGATSSSGGNGGGVWCESVTAVVSNCVLVGNSVSRYGGGAYQGTLNNCTLSGNSAGWGAGASESTLNNCALTGNSAGGSGGGAYACTLYNCTLTGNSTRYNSGGGAYRSTINNCTLTGNSARYSSGGGAFESTLNNCALTDNSASEGGGAYSGTLSNCTLTGNAASYGGGGTAGSTLYNCALTNNSANYDGGGAYGAILTNCTLTGNSAGQRGGGACYGWLTNCRLTGNSAFGGYDGGGGACWGILNNCTLTGNWASRGGGAYATTLNNCIVYLNTASHGSNFLYSSLSYCCTAPLPTSGAGNISADPQLASASHLSALSPCRGAGSTAYSTGTDIDGEPWANPPSMGCDEYYSGSVTGALTVAMLAADTNVTVGFGVEFQAVIAGRVSASRWEFGDGTVVSNRPDVSHAWNTPGQHAVVLTAYNEINPGGVSATALVQVATAPVQYVAVGSTTPVPPYTSWATAASNIQDAVDAAYVGGTILVSDGLYGAGGRAVDGLLTNRVAVEKVLTVRSVNGPQYTVIQGRQVPGTTNGNGAIRCVYLADGASLSGFTLSGGATRDNGDYSLHQSGGGVWCESTNAVVSNCMLTGNTAHDYGGGAYSGTLSNCTLTGNSAGSGGGASGGTLNNCTLTGNSANYGGGASRGTLNNCIVYFNTAAQGANYYQDQSSEVLNYCCTTPEPWGGVGSITNAPLFVDYAGGNLRLQSNSPCINAGNNSYLTNSNLTDFFDLDGRPRIVGGTVDMGAYECQSPALLAYYTWLQNYGLPTDASLIFADSDGDRLNNWQEWRCGTDPTNALSVLRLLTPESDGTNVTVRWTSVTGVTYYVLRSTDLGPSLPFRLLATNIIGQTGTTSYTDTNATSLSPRFYRVGVGNYLAPPSPPAPTLMWQFDAGARQLQLSWSGTGYHLEVQTNSLGASITTNWFRYLGGTTSPVTAPVHPQEPAVFYRLGWL